MEKKFKWYKEDGLYYYTDVKGKVIGGPYTNVISFASTTGLAVAEKPDGMSYYINENFEEVGGPYLAAYGFYSDNNLSCVVNTDRKYYYVNEKCEIVGGPYDRATTHFEDGVAAVVPVGCKIGVFPGECFINEKCEVISGPYNDTVSIDMYGSGRPRFLREDGKWYYRFRDRYVRIEASEKPNEIILRFKLKYNAKAGEPNELDEPSKIALAKEYLDGKFGFVTDHVSDDCSEDDDLPSM